MTIETEVAALTTATTALLGAVNVSKSALDQKVVAATEQQTLAAAQAVIATTKAAESDASATTATTKAIAAEAARAAAVTAQNNAVAVVTGGTATLVAEASKTPIADAKAKLDKSWFADAKLNGAVTLNERPIPQPPIPYKVLEASGVPCVSDVEYRLLNAAATTITLPSNPKPDDNVSWVLDNGRTDNVIGRNGQLINGEATNLTLADSDGTLRFIGGSRGWIKSNDCVRRSGTVSIERAVAELFANGEQGFAAYDFSDFPRLYQDAAGTTPVTAVEQPVGRIVGINGVVATQATTTARAKVAARVNLLTKTEDFSDAVWAKANATVVPNVVASPYGFLTADKLIATAASGSHGVQINTTVGNAAHKYKCFLKAGEYSFADLSLYDNAAGSTRANCVFDLSLGTIVTKGATTVAEITAMADGWYLCEISGLAHTAGVTFAYVRCTPTSSVFFTGDGVSGIYIWGASLTLATDAHLPYQRVNTSADYDADPAKFPAFRRLDGVDDSLASSTGGGGTAGFFFSAAISPQGSAGTARTLFSDTGANTGYRVRLNASDQLELAAGNGTTYTTIATAGTLAVGATDVVQAWDDGVNLNVKIGSGPTASIARPAVVAGTAGYTLGQDNGSSSGYFNGRSYGEIYRKDSAPTQAQREAVALYQRQKARLP